MGVKKKNRRGRWDFGFFEERCVKGNYYDSESGRRMMVLQGEREMITRVDE